jgi:hypothetical protein
MEAVPSTGSGAAVRAEAFGFDGSMGAAGARGAAADAAAVGRAAMGDGVAVRRGAPVGERRGVEAGTMPGAGTDGVVFAPEA